MRKLTVLLSVFVALMLTGCIDTPSDFDFTLNSGLDTVEVNETWIDSGAVFTVNDVHFEVAASELPDLTTLGMKEVKYGYNHEGTEFFITRYLMVVDTTPPVILLNPGIDSIPLNGTWEDTGVIVADNSNEELIPVVTGTVDTTITGDYTITYTVTDSSGNENQVVRIITVY